MMFKIFKTKYSEIQHQFIGIKGKKNSSLLFKYSRKNVHVKYTLYHSAHNFRHMKMAAVKEAKL